MKQVLIVEKDSVTLKQITCLMEALGYSCRVFLSWSSEIMTLSPDDISLIFIDVETPQNKVDRILNRFAEKNTFKDSTNRIPLIFMRSRQQKGRKDQINGIINQYECDAMLLKPMKTEEIYLKIDKILNLGKPPNSERKYQKQLEHFQAVTLDCYNWLDYLWKVAQKGS